MQMKTSLASGIEESILEAPGAIVVVTTADIKQRGYISLAEIIVDLPEFDTILVNGIPYLCAYQRSYRHPSETSRRMCRSPCFAHALKTDKVRSSWASKKGRTANSDEK